MPSRTEKTISRAKIAGTRSKRAPVSGMMAKWRQIRTGPPRQCGRQPTLQCRRIVPCAPVKLKLPDWRGPADEPRLLQATHAVI